MLGLVEARKILRVSDTFTRANSALTMGNAETGQPWAPVVGTWGISSNQAYLAVSGAAVDIMTIETGLSNVRVTCTWAVVRSAQSQMIRYVNSTNYLLLQTDGATLYRLFSRVNGADTVLGTYTAAPVDGDVIVFELVDSSIKMYVNGTLRLDIVDTTHQTATKCGLRSNKDTLQRFDNFQVEAI